MLKKDEAIAIAIAMRKYDKVQEFVSSGGLDERVILRRIPHGTYETGHMVVEFRGVERLFRMWSNDHCQWGFHDRSGQGNGTVRGGKLAWDLLNDTDQVSFSIAEQPGLAGLLEKCAEFEHVGLEVDVAEVLSKF